VQAQTLDELYEKHKRVQNNIKVIDEKGCDILRHDLLTDLD
jgi:uncharacterized protein YnzC (UPF0291/DUF896 family)